MTNENLENTEIGNRFDPLSRQIRTVMLNRIREIGLVTSKTPRLGGCSNQEIITEETTKRGEITYIVKGYFQNPDSKASRGNPDVHLYMDPEVNQDLGEFIAKRNGIDFRGRSFYRFNCDNERDVDRIFDAGEMYEQMINERPDLNQRLEREFDQYKTQRGALEKQLSQLEENYRKIIAEQIREK